MNAWMHGLAENYFTGEWVEAHSVLSLSNKVLWHVIAGTAFGQVCRLFFLRAGVSTYLIRWQIFLFILQTPVGD